MKYYVIYTRQYVRINGKIVNQPNYCIRQKVRNDESLQKLVNKENVVFIRNLENNTIIRNQRPDLLKDYIDLEKD